MFEGDKKQLDSVFLSEFDCLVMLTWSDWHTELRSNRYHYVTRFAATGKEVVFVQPDLLVIPRKIINVWAIHFWLCKRAFLTLC